MPIWLLKLRSITSIFIFIAILFSLLTACRGETPTDSGDTDTGGGETGNTQALDITQISPSDYRWVDLATGVDTYVDRAIIYTTVPTSLLSQRVQQTWNRDKVSTDPSYISFSVNKSVIVYVAYDSRNSSVNERSVAVLNLSPGDGVAIPLPV